MIETNELIINFIQNNWILILLLYFSLIRIIPPEWAGFWKHKDDDISKPLSPKITIMHWMLHMIIESLINAAFLPVISIFGLKNMVSLIILSVVGFDVFSRHQISSASVTLAGIGIIALYLDKLVETGKTISILGGLMKWERFNKPKV